MKIIIEHRKTKREVNGAFSFCLSKEDLKNLKSIIDEKLETDFQYGWIRVDELITDTESDFDILKRQKCLVNTPPVNWD